MTPVHRSVAIAAVLAWWIACPATAQQIRSRDLPWAALGGAYDAQIETAADIRCPAADVGVTVASGVLPRGLELSGDRLQGTPLEMGSFPLTFRAANGCRSTTKELVLFVTGKPVLRVGPEELVIQYRAGEPDPAPQSILVGSTWPHLAYSVTSEPADWLKFSVTEGYTPDRGAAFSSDAVWVRVLPQKLPPGTYKCALVVSAWLGANAPVVSVTLKVLP
jgi:hypothetical protein